MILADVNVLIYAFRKDSSRHPEYRAWLKGVIEGRSAYDVSPQALAGVVRICTHPGIYRQPSTLAEALRFCDDLLTPPHSTLVQPGEQHWAIFGELCRTSRATGNLVQDAWFAALAIEHGWEWMTTDDDYRRFSGLRWRRPLD